MIQSAVKIQWNMFRLRIHLRTSTRLQSKNAFYRVTATTTSTVPFTMTSIWPKWRPIQSVDVIFTLQIGFDLCFLQMFLDLGERNLINGQNLKRGTMLGRGAFGFVYRATATTSANGAIAEVAMKMLQPVDPGTEARSSILQIYKVISLAE